jgi:hypothetical protein
MRIPLPQNQSLAEKVNTDDEDEEEEEEEEEAEEEEEERRLLMGEEDQERESVGEGEYSNAFNSHNEPIISLINNVQNLKDKENREEVSFNSINHAPNLNQPVLTLIEIGGSTSKQGGTTQQNSLGVNGGSLLGQKKGVVGPTNPVNSHATITGGADRRLTQSENLDYAQKPNFLMMRESGGKGETKGGVYSDGPRIVYKKLNPDPKTKTIPLKKKNSLTKEPSRVSILPSASLRTQHRMAQALGNKSRKAQSVSSSSNVRATFSDEASGPAQVAPCSDGVTRNPPQQLKKISNTSLSSAGEILCCSTINSTDIRNCNNTFLKKLNHEVASKVWKGAVELGVEGDEEDGRYVERIVSNEGREVEVRNQTEHCTDKNP